MKAALLAVAVLLAIAVPAAAKNAKVFVFVAPQGPAGFQAVPRTLADSAEDLRRALSEVSYVTDTRTRADAAIVVEVTSREEAQGEFRVHVHVTTVDGQAADLTGASVHRWKESAAEIAVQLAAWAKAHPDPSPHQKALIDAGVK